MILLRILFFRYKTGNSKIGGRTVLKDTNISIFLHDTAIENLIFLKNVSLSKKKCRKQNK
jgi:hypothetical protein